MQIVMCAAAASLELRMSFKNLMNLRGEEAEGTFGQESTRAPNKKKKKDQENDTVTTTIVAEELEDIDIIMEATVVTDGTDSAEEETPPNAPNYAERCKMLFLDYISEVEKKTTAALKYDVVDYMSKLWHHRKMCLYGAEKIVAKIGVEIGFGVPFSVSQEMEIAHTRRRTRSGMKSLLEGAADTNFTEPTMDSTMDAMSDAEMNEKSEDDDMAMINAENEVKAGVLPVVLRGIKHHARMRDTHFFANYFNYPDISCIDSEDEATLEVHHICTAVRLLSRIAGIMHELLTPVTDPPMFDEIASVLSELYKNGLPKCTLLPVGMKEMSSSQLSAAKMLRAKGRLATLKRVTRVLRSTEQERISIFGKAGTAIYKMLKNCESENGVFEYPVIEPIIELLSTESELFKKRRLSDHLRQQLCVLAASAEVKMASIVETIVKEGYETATDQSWINPRHLVSLFDINDMSYGLVAALTFLDVNFVWDYLMPVTAYNVVREWKDADPEKQEVLFNLCGNAEFIQKLHTRIEPFMDIKQMSEQTHAINFLALKLKKTGSSKDELEESSEEINDTYRKLLVTIGQTFEEENPTLWRVPSKQRQYYKQIITQSDPRRQGQNLTDSVHLSPQVDSTPSEVGPTPPPVQSTAPQVQSTAPQVQSTAPQVQSTAPQAVPMHATPSEEMRGLVVNPFLTGEQKAQEEQKIQQICESARAASNSQVNEKDVDKEILSNVEKYNEMIENVKLKRCSYGIMLVKELIPKFYTKPRVMVIDLNSAIDTYSNFLSVDTIDRTVELLQWLCKQIAAAAAGKQKINKKNVRDVMSAARQTEYSWETDALKKFFEDNSDALVAICGYLLQADGRTGAKLSSQIEGMHQLSSVLDDAEAFKQAWKTHKDIIVKDCASSWFLCRHGVQ